MKKNIRNESESISERCKILQQIVDKSAQINRDNDEKVRKHNIIDLTS